VAADDDLFRTDVAGAVLLGQNLAGGVSAALNKITRTTEAFIGKPAGSAPGASTLIDVEGPVEVSATTGGKLWSFALAAAVTMPATQEKEPAPEAEDGNLL